MAGSIEVDGQLWTAASWLFDWVLNRIVDDAEVDQYVAVMVREIVDENLGWFSLRDLDPADRPVLARGSLGGGRGCQAAGRAGGA
jgi:hypothetical protein